LHIFASVFSFVPLLPFLSLPPPLLSIKVFRHLSASKCVWQATVDWSDRKLQHVAGCKGWGVFSSCCSCCRLCFQSTFSVIFL